MKFFQNNKDSKGFSLIEVLISISILGIVLIVFMNLFTQAFSYTQKNENKTVGINVARNVLNYMESQDFDEIKKKLTAKSITFDSKNYKGTGIKFDGDPSTVLKMTINNVDYYSTVTIKKHNYLELWNYLIPVTVKVEWGDNMTTSLEGGIKNEKAPNTNKILTN